MTDTPFSDIPARGISDRAASASKWEDLLRPAAEAAPDIALLLVSGHQPPSLAQANNNSFCQAIQSSPRHAHLCEPYCGQAFFQTLGAEGATAYRCHAGFHCFAVKVPQAQGRQLAVIGGRAFVEGADYYVLEKRTRTGDLRDLAAADLFDNIHLTTPQDLQAAAGRVSHAMDANHNGGEVLASSSAAHASNAIHSPVNGNSVSGNHKTSSRPTHRAIMGNGNQDALSHVPQLLLPSGMSLKEAGNAVLEAITAAYKLGATLLALRLDGAFIRIGATGELVTNAPTLELDSRDAELLRAAEAGEWVLMKRDANPSAKAEDARGGVAVAVKERHLFPFVIGGEVRGALVVSDGAFDEAKRRSLADFCREVATPLEVLRLREELERCARVAQQLQSFTETVHAVSPDEAYTAILAHSTNLVRSERGSLLLYDAAAEELAVMAATGPRVEAMRAARVRLGDGVAGTVLQSGRPLIVTDMDTSRDYAPAPLERSYKTTSFISYPIIIRGAPVGVLNVTDKRGGGVYDELDLSLLQMITPQLVLALDCAEWQQKATRYQLLSITDPLTDLLNRRYLEERLAEETERSKRSRYPMSFMMIDIDDFKVYNDHSGHQAGDLALEMTAQNLKSALRSADVAARYGGEEFCVLLPQTSLEEARVIAERIRRRVERTRYPHGAEQPLGAVTVSIGISTFTPDTDSPASIINAADQALYTAKRLGKNRVEPQEK